MTYHSVDLEPDNPPPPPKTISILTIPTHGNNLSDFPARIFVIVQGWKLPGGKFSGEGIVWEKTV